MCIRDRDQVWNRVTVNRAEKKATRYYMDEFHLLLKEEQTAAYSVEIWKRFRKWGGIPTAITQNVKDLLASREVENIFENSDFVLMLNQAPVSYTHLDVYKRQVMVRTISADGWRKKKSLAPHGGTGNGGFAIDVYKRQVAIPST